MREGLCRARDQRIDRTYSGDACHRLPRGRAVALRAGPARRGEAARLRHRRPPGEHRGPAAARARAFFAAAQLRPAELEFTIVLEREPDNAFAHFALARTYERQGRPDQARRHFRLAAALDPNPEFLKAARFDS
ncbi:tetratricopeptide (TPR) repeat protein [Streptomyces sp. SAI-218]